MSKWRNPKYLTEIDNVTRYVEFVESSGQPNVVSYSGAVGLMGIKPSTAMGAGYDVPPLRPAELYDPVKNHNFGREYLSGLLTKYRGNVPDALLAYSWGGGNVDKWIAGGRTGSIPADKQAYIDGWAGIGVHAEEYKKANADGWKPYLESNPSLAKQTPEQVAEINSLYSEGPSGQGIGAQQAVTREQAWSKANEFLDQSQP